MCDSNIWLSRQQSAVSGPSGRMADGQVRAGACRCQAWGGGGCQKTKKRECPQGVSQGPARGMSA
eukprot:scaffold19546_cov65-Cyclotella_meneghiniana.AAC.8